ncbi:MAG: DedA family protein [Cyanobacteria bacterium J069]
MAEWITQTMEALGYWGIGLLMFLENLFPPIPSELIMPLAGFTVAQGKMQFGPAVAAGVAGTVLGALPWYMAGKILGEATLKRWADRYGKWLTISGRDIEKAIAWFHRYGGRAVFLGRLVPGVRTLISLPAGLSRMNIAVFLLYSTAGTLIWTLLLTYAGYLLGDNYELIEVYVGPLSKVVLVGLAIALGFWLWRRQRRRIR